MDAEDCARENDRSSLTLAEIAGMKTILVVLLVIASGVAVFAYQVWRILSHAHPHSPPPHREIGQLQTAIQAYWERVQQYPPCLAQINVADRKVRFMRHVQIAFPNSNLATSSKQFDVIRENLIAGNGVTSQPYNYKNAAGDIKPLDLYTLDPAESLVFWLGGFPTPVNPASRNSVANRRLFGFHRDSDAPFRRGAVVAEGLDALRYRTDPMYQFDETRLVDYDDDGWLEYLPIPQKGTSLAPPFVYFDAATYATPTNNHMSLAFAGYPENVVLAKQWGVARPLLTEIDPGDLSKSVWGNPKSFQIVFGGFDGRYGPPLDTSRGEIRLLTTTPLRVYQSFNGQAFQEASLDDDEEDNQTNLSIKNPCNDDPFVTSTDPDSIDPKLVREQIQNR
jgi:hypothetical protein